MKPSPRFTAAVNGSEKQGSKPAAEILLEKLLAWLRVKVPALPLCRSGRHVWLSLSDREKCCNGFRRSRIYLTVNGRGVRRNYWREINSTQDTPFSWEPIPRNRSSRLTIRGASAVHLLAQGDDNVNVTFVRPSGVPQYYDTKLNGGAILRRPRMSMIDAAVAGGQLDARPFMADGVGSETLRARFPGNAGDGY